MYVLLCAFLSMQIDFILSLFLSISLYRVRSSVTFSCAVTQYCVFIGFAQVVKLIKRSTGFFLGFRFSYYPREQQNGIVRMDSRRVGFGIIRFMTPFLPADSDPTRTRHITQTVIISRKLRDTMVDH